MTPASQERSRVRTPILLVSAAAWGILILRPSGMGSSCPMHGHSLQGMLARPGSMALSWALMLCAMMLPVMTAPVGHVRDRSFAHRRARATILFLAGYGAVWMAAGAALSAFGVVIASAETWLPTLVVGLVVTLWQVSPPKQTCLNRLHAHPHLAAFGVAADLDRLRFGLAHGTWCVGSCSGLMLLPMLFSSGHWLAMAAASLWMWGEPLTRPTPPRWSLRTPTRAVSLAFAQARMRASAYASAVSVPG